MRITSVKGTRGSSSAQSGYCRQFWPVNRDILKEHALSLIDINGISYRMTCEMTWTILVLMQKYSRGPIQYKDVILPV